MKSTVGTKSKNPVIFCVLLMVKQRYAFVINAMVEKVFSNSLKDSKADIYLIL